MDTKVVSSRLKRIMPPLLLLIASISLFASDAPRKAAILLGLANSNASVTASERPFAAPFFASISAATINTDKDDYRPGETVVISGSGWAPGEQVRLQVVHIEPQLESLTPHEGHDPWIVNADSSGNVAATWLVDEDSLNQTLLLTAEGLTSGLTASKVFTDSSVGTYDQCANDDGDGYDTGDLGCQWTNGNLNGNNSTYSEGDSTVQRLWIEDFEPGATSQSITLQYGTTKGSKHAYDFLTTWDHSEDWITVNDLCQAPTGASTNTIPGCVSAFPAASLYDIPDDPVVPNTFEPNGAGDRQFTMLGATITNVSTPTPFSGTFPTGDNETRITITFTVNNSGPLCATSQGSLKCDIMLFFGAHISRTDDWTPVTGQGGATTIPGSPYHVALAQLNGASIGQRDNQMQASAIVLPAAQLTIVKEAFPEDPQNFEFQPSANLNGGANFFLDDDGLGGDEACTGGNCLDQRVFTSLPAGTYSVAEINSATGWTLTGAVCSDGSPVNNIVLDSGENVICTFTNRRPDAQIDLSPLTATNRVGEAHTVTATVQQDDQYPAGAPGDGTTGFGPAPDGTTVNFSLLNNTAGASFSGPSSCQTVGGSCSVQINTTTAGSVDIRGTTTFSVIGVSLTRTTNSGGLNSADANKVYVDAKIAISPLTDTNPVNEAHTFTATVQQDDGLAAGAGGDGVTGWANAPNGTLVTFAFVQNTIGAVFVGGNTCTTTNGQCTVQINSSAPGVVIVSATTTFNVGGLSMTRTTGTGGNNSANAQKTYVAGVIIIDKVTVPAADPQLFTFTPSYGSPFQLADQTAPNNSGNLAPGTYSVAETVPAGWDLTSATCSDGSPVTAIVLGAGETVTCTFTNEKDAFIILEKQTIPDGDMTVFNFNRSYGIDVGLSDGQQNNSGDLDPGPYSASEDVPAGWDLTSTICTSSIGDTETAAALELDAGETITCVFTNTKRGKILVDKVTNPSGSTQLFEFDTNYGANFFLDDDDPLNDSGALQPGTYSVAEVNIATGWVNTGAVCDDGSPITAIALGAGETVTCTFTNQRLPQLRLIKDIIPNTDSGLFDLRDGGVVKVDEGGDGADSGFFFTTVGSHTVDELAGSTSPTTLDDYVSKVECDSGKGSNDPGTSHTFSLAYTEIVTCTFTNTRKASVQVIKTFQGGPITGPETFTFTLREGASATEVGTTLETQVANSTNGGTLNFTTKLIPGQSYQICEVVMVGWSSSIGSLPGAFVIQTEPDGDNSTYCVAFTPTAGENVVITIDNTPPPDGDARTIGYWKNWSSCTRGNQAPVLDYILWSFAGGTRVEVELPLPNFPIGTYVGTNLGNYQVTTCADAFNILSKRLADGTAKNGRSLASNAAVNMAAQLLAAKLNIQASADPSCIEPVIALADAYLVAVNYNGTTAPTFSKSTGNAMNFLAGLLDDYNNNDLSCPLPPLPPAP